MKPTQNQLVCNRRSACAVSAIQKLREMNAEFLEFFHQRDEEVHGLFVAAVSRKHILFVGPPGTCKSYMVQTFANNVSDHSRYFYQQLTKESTSKDLFVSEVSVRERDAGEFRSIEFYNSPTGRLGECHFAFLDEIFLASHACLTSLLQLLPTRTFSVNAGQDLKSPLMTLVGASNRLPGPEDGYLEHLLDRFLLRYEVSYLRDPDEFCSMLNNDIPEPQTTITLNEIQALQQLVPTIMMSDTVHRAIWSIREKLKAEGIQPSDRRFKESLALLQARALIRGRDYVDISDLDILRHSLWTRETEIKPVRDAVLQIANEDLAKAERLYDEARDVFECARGRTSSDPGELGEYERKLRTIAEELKEVANGDIRIATLHNQVVAFVRQLKAFQEVDEPLLSMPAAKPLDLNR